MLQFKIGKTYNFNTLAPTVLGDLQESMKVMAIMGFDEAIKYHDIVTLHDNVKNNLITEADLQVNDLTFILFKCVDGSSKILPLEYINSKSITEVTKVKIIVEIETENNEDLQIIKETLLNAGYLNGKYRVEII